MGESANLFCVEKIKSLLSFKKNYQFEFGHP